MKSKKIISLFSYAAVAAFIFQSGLVQAETERDHRDLPKSGSLSETYSGPGTNSGMPGPWGGSDLTGGTAAPISGSVSKIGTDKWLMRVFNNSKDTYSVSLAVVQQSATASSIKRDSFSYTLKPGQTAERQLARHPLAQNAALELLSWRNLTPKKSNAEESPDTVQ